MGKRTFWMLLICFLVLLAGCSRLSQNSFAPANDGVDIPEEFDNSMIIIGGENGIMGQYPEDSEDEDPEVTEPTEPAEVFVDLPDGSRVPEANVQTLEDGTVVAFTGEPTGHKCFFTDGTYAITRYMDAEGTACTFSVAAELNAEWYLQDGAQWKTECYKVKGGGELFLLTSCEREYTQVEIGNEDSPWYHSATVERWYDEDTGTYLTARAEYDLLHGSDKPIKWVYHDGSYSEHVYNMDGSKEKDLYYAANGTQTQAEFYENDQLITRYLFRENGSQQYVTHFKDGVISSESYYGESGYYDTTYYENGVRTYTLGHYDDGSTSSIYYDDSGLEVKYLANAPDGSLKWYALYKYYDSGHLKTTTYYDADGNVTNVEQYDDNGNLIQ